MDAAAAEASDLPGGVEPVDGSGVKSECTRTKELRRERGGEPRHQLDFAGDERFENDLGVVLASYQAGDVNDSDSRRYVDTRESRRSTAAPPRS